MWSFSLTSLEIDQMTYNKIERKNLHKSTLKSSTKEVMLIRCKNLYYFLNTFFQSHPIHNTLTKYFLITNK